jgi:penicillin-binding protein 1B
MLQEVIRSGTGASVRGRGVTIPVAGKTGTSRDGWFAGFSSKLVCVVWVGFDDGTELNLEGAHSALPIWAEFMKRAHTHREYRNVQGWDAPDGIVSVDIDPLSGGLATPMCPSAHSEYFISGSQPVELCRLHSNGTTQVAGWETTPAKPQQPGTPVPGPVGTPPPTAEIKTAQTQPPVPGSPEQQAQQAEKPRQKKGGFFGRLKEIFK